MYQINNMQPIGVFDSGIGGLTVVKSIMDNLPHENIIYFGDIARLPYGTKSVTTIKKFAKETVKFLLKQEVKAIVIACNTISSVATEDVKKLAGNIPVIDVISAGSQSSAFISRNNHIGVIATPATINSNAYQNAIISLNSNNVVISQACPLFVPFIESGILKHKALELMAKDYLQILIDKEIDTLVLGCTHYPLIKDIISNIMGDKVTIIDPAIKSCELLHKILADNKLLNPQKKSGHQKFFVTDIPLNFQTIGESFLNTHMQLVELVSLDK